MHLRRLRLPAQRAFLEALCELRRELKTVGEWRPPYSDLCVQILEWGRDRKNFISV